MKKRWALLGGLGLGAVIWGLLGEAQGALEGPEDDDGLAEKVRARVAGTVSRPDTVRVTVENGVVTLSGTVPAVEFDRLVSRVLRVRGVRDVNDQLDVRPTADGGRDFQDTPVE